VPNCDLILLHRLCYSIYHLTTTSKPNCVSCKPCMIVTSTLPDTTPTLSPMWLIIMTSHHQGSSPRPYPCRDFIIIKTSSARSHRNRKLITTKPHDLNFVFIVTSTGFFVIAWLHHENFIIFQIVFTSSHRPCFHYDLISLFYSSSWFCSLAFSSPWSHLWLLHHYAFITFHQHLIPLLSLSSLICPGFYPIYSSHLAAALTLSLPSTYLMTCWCK